MYCAGLVVELGLEAEVLRREPSWGRCTGVFPRMPIAQRRGSLLVELMHQLELRAQAPLTEADIARAFSGPAGFQDFLTNIRREIDGERAQAASDHPPVAAAAPAAGPTPDSQRTPRPAEPTPPCSLHASHTFRVCVSTQAAFGHLAAQLKSP